MLSCKYGAYNSWHGNREHKDWPNFVYDPEQFAAYERQFLHKAGAIHGSMKHISAADQETLKVELISDEAYKTSEIEGAILNRDSLQIVDPQTFRSENRPKKSTARRTGDRRNDGRPL